jgi:hypothetical protein
MTPDNFEKPRNTFGGIYRGLVEDNDDPLDSGRIKVRIFGMHDTEKMTIAELPWAYPALGLYSSGGYNINNEDFISEPPKKDKGQRYNPGNRSKIEKSKDNSVTFNKPNDKKFVEDRMDPVGNSCGTGGQFVVPNRGNWVFIFFEAGNHMVPIYFAMAPMARDWNIQKIQRNEEIVQKINQIRNFKKDFHPRGNNISPNAENTWTNNSKVDADIGSPNLDIKDIKDSNSNRDIFCTTTAQGTTLVIDNRYGKEKIYLIHKNTIEHTDENGNKLMYVGKSRGIKKIDQTNVPSDNDPDIACNYEIGVEGNSELYVLGEYKVYAKGGAFFQVDGDAQFDVTGDIGLVSQQGNINAIIKNGNLNIDSYKDLNINVNGNTNIQVEKDANINIKGNLKATVSGTSDLTLKDTIKLLANSDLNISVAGNTKIKSTTFDIVTTNLKVSGNVDLGGNVKIGQNLDVVQNISVGQFAFVFAGINCGGTLINRGLAELGSPCILHLATVLPGMAPGTGKSPQTPSTPSSPDTAVEAQKVFS